MQLCAVRVVDLCMYEVVVLYAPYSKYQPHTLFPRQRRKPGSVTCPWNTITVRWDPDEEQPESTPITTTVNAWEIDELEEDSTDNEEGPKVLREQSVGRGNETAHKHSPSVLPPGVHSKLVSEDPLTSGTMSHVSVGLEDGVGHKRKWDGETQPVNRRAADRSSVASGA